MPRYFIDTTGELYARDEEGQEYPDLRAVRAVVRRTLGAMVQHHPGEQHEMTVSAMVRDEAGDAVMTGRITITMGDT